MSHFSFVIKTFWQISALMWRGFKPHWAGWSYRFPSDSFDCYWHSVRNALPQNKCCFCGKRVHNLIVYIRLGCVRAETSRGVGVCWANIIPLALVQNLPHTLLRSPLNRLFLCYANTQSHTPCTYTEYFRDIFVCLAGKVNVVLFSSDWSNVMPVDSWLADRNWLLC